MLRSEQPGNSQLNDHTIDVVLYKTQTLCIPCSLIEHRGFDAVDAVVSQSLLYKWLLRATCQVRQKGQAVYLERKCSIHGRESTLYCSDAAFFRQMLRYARPASHPFSGDIEDFKEKHAHRQPLMLHLPVRN